MVNTSKKSLTQKIFSGLPSSNLSKDPTYPEKVNIPRGSIRRAITVVPPYSQGFYTDTIEPTGELPPTPELELSTGILTVNTNGSGTLWSTTLSKKAKLKHISFGGMTTSGTWTYFRVEIRIRQSNVGPGTWFVSSVYFNNGAASRHLLMQDMIFPAGTEISLHGRRSGGTSAECKANFMLEYL